MGLGLSFVAWIVKAHGGKIDVSSEVGRGSRFVVTLPRAASMSAVPVEV
jgi:two-component system OmpR family sensor kinase